MRLRDSVSDLIALVAVVSVGLGIATLPHWRTGSAVWPANYDELAFYMPLGAAAYRDHPWRLTDPATGGPIYYQPLPTVPGILIATALGLGPWSPGMIWRILGGLMISLGSYLLFRLRFNPFAASAAACILLADPGVLHGQLGYSLIKTCVRPLPPVDDPEHAANKLLPQWRILNPAVSWPWWLAFILLTARAVTVSTRARVIAAGIACGLLFHVYFYFWTTAVAGLLLAILLDRERRLQFLQFLGIGIVIGLPALVSASQFRAEHGSDWLLRADKFLPISRFGELLIPRASIVLLGGVWLWVWLRRWEWAWLAAIATTALVLLNHTAITGLQIENLHWNLAYGPAMSCLLVLVVADFLGRLPFAFARFGPLVAWILAIAAVAAAVALKMRVVDRSTENSRIRPAFSAFQEQMSAVTLPGGGAVAGEPDLQYFAAVQANLRPLSGCTAELSPISDAELDTRIALSGHLRGWSRERFTTEQDATLRAAQWGPVSRSAEARAARLAARLAEFDAIALDPTSAVERFDARVLARLATESDLVPSGWTLLQRGPRWNVWVRAR